MRHIPIQPLEFERQTHDDPHDDFIIRRLLRMSKIFISHSSANNAAALALAKWLADEGWNDYFLDITPTRGLVPGERWQEKLRSAADRCEAVVVLVSPAWLASSWCLAEFLLAKQLGKTIIGVIIESTPFAGLPRELTSERQLCDLVAGDDRQPFRVSEEPIVAPTDVSFSQAGLTRLRLGLQRAGLAPSSFPWPPPGDPDRAPYRGLNGLSSEDAAVFFGREPAVIRGLDALRAMSERGVERLFVIVGASGAGKSSFLRAGLWPRLAREDRHFLPLPVIRPERAAISGTAGLVASLETAFREAGAGRSRAAINQALLDPGGLDALLGELQTLAARRIDTDADTMPPAVVISIDQGEELFASEGEAEAGRLLEWLAHTLSASGVEGDGNADSKGGGAQPLAARQRVLAIVAIRSDSYERLQTEKRLAPVSQFLFSLPPIARGEYKTVIEGPAQRQTDAGRKLSIDPALTERLLNETEGADALPLLAFTLERLYVEHGGDGKLMLEDYEALGGVRGSIQAAVAEAFDEPERSPAVPSDRAERDRLLHAGFIPWLARVDPDTEERKRRVARWDEIPLDARPLLERLIDARLLVRDRRMLLGREEAVVVEVAHEALLRQWPLLAIWLDQDAEALKTLDAVQRAASEWISESARTRGESADGEAWLLHGGERLALADACQRRPDFQRLLGAEAVAYLDACRAREKRIREEREERAQAERVARERELEQAKALADEQRQRADEQARARLRQRRLSWSLFALLAISVAAAVYGWQQRGQAEAQRRHAETALAETRQGLLRAQSAELRAMIERLDLLRERANSTGDQNSAQAFDAEHLALTARLEKISHELLVEIAKGMGFRGDLEWLSKQEGNVGGVKSTGMSVLIDPATDLSFANADVIKARYEFLLSPDEMKAVLAVVGKRGEQARQAFKENQAILERIQLSATDVARLVPEAVAPFWRGLVAKYPVLSKDTTPGSVQTATLSLAFNMGVGSPVWKLLSPAIEQQDWPHLADLIETSMDSGRYSSMPVYRALKRRRIEEANMIRTELKLATR